MTARILLVLVLAVVGSGGCGSRDPLGGSRFDAAAPTDVAEPIDRPPSSGIDRPVGVDRVPAFDAGGPAFDVGGPAFDVRPDASSPSNHLELDPSTLTFFNLPINSVRYAVSGYDPVHRACVSLLFDYSNTGRAAGAHCDDFGAMFPYAIVKLDTDGPCGEWDYGGNTEVVSAEGCIDFAGEAPGSINRAQLAVRTEGGAFTGTIAVDNWLTLDPRPMIFSINYSTDIPENVYVQSGDAYGLPAWVTVTHAQGQPLLLFDRCDAPICGEMGGVCGAALTRVTNLTQGTYRGIISLEWDGLIRVLDPSAGCYRRERPPMDASYQAEFCVGYQVVDDPGGQTVTSTTCATIDFAYPTARVQWNAAFGG